MMRKLVWAAGMAGYFAFDLAVGAFLSGPAALVIMLMALLLGGMAMGLFVGMQPRRYSPDTLLDRSKLLGAFLVAAVVGALLGIALKLSIGIWLPALLIGLVLLAFTLKLGSARREVVTEAAEEKAPEAEP
jgi:hypothetical protein